MIRQTYQPLAQEIVTGAEKRRNVGQSCFRENGVPVAMLGQLRSARKVDSQAVIQQMRAYRTGRSLKGMSLGKMIEEGRS